MGQNKNFVYNLPLQAYRNKNGKVTILNYMPRKDSVCELNLSEFNETNTNEKDIFYGTACNLINLALLFIEFAEGKRDSVCYHDEDIDKHFPPSPYSYIVSLLPFKTLTPTK